MHVSDLVTTTGVNHIQSLDSFIFQIEIKLKKQDGIRWQTLERDLQQDSVKQFNPSKSC